VVASQPVWATMVGDLGDLGDLGER